MTDDERKSLKQKTLAELDALQERISALEFSVGQIPPDSEMDSATRREALDYKRRCEAEMRAAIARIPRLEATVKRIEAPDYGICVDCDKPIALERLTESPDEFFCEECAANLL